MVPWLASRCGACGGEAEAVDRRNCRSLVAGAGRRYRRYMHRYAIGLVLLCIHCGGSSQTAPPTEEPPPPAAAPAPAETTEAPAAETPSAAPTATAEAPAASAAPVPKPCPELPKGTCKVTKGCAWNDLLKCVKEGP